MLHIPSIVVYEALQLARDPRRELERRQLVAERAHDLHDAIFDSYTHKHISVIIPY